MQLTLQRRWTSEKSTIGELYINNAFFCFTLEDRLRATGLKVHGQTAIPAGQYSIAITMSRRFKRLLPLLLDVPQFEGIRIHPGNRAENTEGCILVGFTRNPDFIGESRNAFDALFQKLCDANKRGAIKITISNPPNWSVEALAAFAPPLQFAETFAPQEAQAPTLPLRQTLSFNSVFVGDDWKTSYAGIFAGLMNFLTEPTIKGIVTSLGMALIGRLSSHAKN
jgi:hypothetical protein